MPEPAQFREALETIPEILALRTCAVRRRVRLGLFGGIVRNLFLDFHRWENRPDVSLFDFVGPFSDIDVVLDDIRDWPAVLSSVSESVPLAGYHRWEIAQRSHLERAAPTFERILVDRLIIWLNGRISPPTIELDAVGVPPDQVFYEYTHHLFPDPIPSTWREPDAFIALLLLALKLGRYLFEFPPADAVLEHHEFEPILDRLTDAGKARQAARRRQPALSALDLSRLELAVLDLLFNSMDLEFARGVLSILAPLFPAESMNRSRVLREVLNNRGMLEADQIGALVYPASPAGPLRSRLMFYDAAPQGPDGPGSVIPWTPMFVPRPGFDDDCCRYRDFQLGVAVIAWRPRAKPLIVPGAQGADHGVVARFDLEGPYPGSGSEIVIPIPGILRRGPALAVRLDHGYVRAVARRSLRFEVGLVPTEP